MNHIISYIASHLNFITFILGVVLFASLITTAILTELRFKRLRKWNRDMSVNWQSIYTRLLDLETIYRNHQYAKCPYCNRIAIAGRGCEGLEFICPHCAELSTWDSVGIDGKTTYLLIPVMQSEQIERAKPRIVQEVERLRNGKRI